jgi:hypothetical protein
MGLARIVLSIIDRPREAMQQVASRPRSWLLAAVLLVASLVLLTAISAPQQIELANERSQAMIEQLKASMSEEQAPADTGLAQWERAPCSWLLDGSFGLRSCISSVWPSAG